MLLFLVSVGLLMVVMVQHLIGPRHGVAFVCMCARMKEGGGSNEQRLKEAIVHDRVSGL